LSLVLVRRIIVRQNVCNKANNVESHVLFGFWKTFKT